MRCRLLAVLVAALSVAACNSDPIRPPPPASGTGGDGDATGGDGDDDGDTTGGDGDTTGDGDEPPAPGDLINVRTFAGAGSRVSMARAADGSLVVAARHKGPIAADDISLPAPDGRAIVVMKLDAAGAVLWARSFGAAELQELDVRDIAVTSDHRAVIVGRFEGAMDIDDRVLDSNGGTTGFAISLAGDTGVSTWAQLLDSGTACTGIGRSVAAASDGAIYVYGARGGESRDDCSVVLERWTGAGEVDWQVALPTASIYADGSLAVDPSGRPVISGQFSREIQLGDRHYEAESDVFGSARIDWFVAGFDDQGVVRFSTHLADDRSLRTARLTAADDGVTLAVEPRIGSLYIDGAFMHQVGFEYNWFAVRLDDTGSLVDYSVWHGAGDIYPRDLHRGADGSVAILSTCNGDIESAQPIRCPEGANIALASVAPGSLLPRWSTTLSSSFQVIGGAVVPGNAHIAVAGELQGAGRFGSTDVDGDGLFVAWFADGAVPSTDYLPAPAVEDIELEESDARQIRQGGEGTLIITGEHLDSLSGAALGNWPARVEVIDDSSARIVLRVPHGHALGRFPLDLYWPGGSASVDDAVEVTPLVVAPSGPRQARGTYEQPMAFCRDFGVELLQGGSTLHLVEGEYTCSESMYLDRGITITAPDGATLEFVSNGSLRLGYGVAGTDTVSGLTIRSRSSYALVLEADAVVSDITIDGARSAGIQVRDADVELRDFRYTNGSDMGLMVTAGEVTARGLVVETTGATGVWARRGRLYLEDCSIEGREHALELGDRYVGEGPALEATECSFDSAVYGIEAERSRLVLHESRIQARTDAEREAFEGVVLRGSSLEMNGGSIEGFNVGAHFRERTPTGVPGFSSLNAGSPELSSFRDVAITANVTGVLFRPDLNDARLSIRSSSIEARANAAVEVNGRLDAVDLGTADDPGNNELVCPDGVALHDRRASASSPIDAHGTTLNGQTFETTQVGPLSVPGAFSIDGPNEIRF